MFKLIVKGHEAPTLYRLLTPFSKALTLIPLYLGTRALLYTIRKDAGIYALKCTVNQCAYIGSTSNFRSRLLQHLRDLRKGRHHSYLLQFDWNKYGEEAFDFEVIELCSSEECLSREQVWITARGVGRKNKSYNINPIAEKPPSGKGRVMSEETKLKLLESRQLREFVVTAPNNNEYFVKNLAKFCRQFSLNMKQLNRLASGDRLTRKYLGWECRHASESKEEYYARTNPLSSHSGRTIEFLVVAPDQTKFRVDNLKAFCREHDLSYNSMGLLAKGISLVHKGYRCTLANEPDSIRIKRLELEKKQSEGWIVRTPEGQEIHVNSLRQYCIEHGLSAGNMHLTAIGKRSHTHGYSCRYVNEPEDIRALRLAPPKEKPNRFVITTPENNEVEIPNLREYCRSQGISAACMHRVLSGWLAHHKGYRARYVDPRPSFDAHPTPQPTPPTSQPAIATHLPSPATPSKPTAPPTYTQLCLQLE